MVGIGGLVLLVSMFFFDWYTIGGAVGSALESLGTLAGKDVETGFSAWDHQGFTGTIANLVILVAGVAALGLVVSRAMSSDLELPVPPSTAVAGLGGLATLMILLRMLFQPGPNDVISLEWGIFVALVAALLIAVGGFLWMQSEGATFDQAKDQLRASTPPGQPPQSPPPGGGQPPPGGPPPPGAPPT